MAEPSLASGAQLSLLMGPLTFAPVPRAVADALVEAQVTVSTGERSGFSLRFAMGRGSVLERELLPGGFFTPPTRVILVVTIGGAATVLSDGVIGKVDVARGARPGATTLSVSGGDVSTMMDRVDLTGLPMPAMPAVARVQFILRLYSAYGIVPVTVPGVADLLPPNPLRQIPAQQGTDYAYLNQLADETGYVFYVEPGPVPGANVAYWGPEVRLSLQPQPPLRIDMGPSSNLDSMTFGFDGLRKTAQVAWVHNPLTKFPIPVPVPDLNPLSPPLGPGIIAPRTIEQLGHAGTSDHDRSDATAKAQLPAAVARALARAAQSANVVQASGTLDARRYGGLLRARQLVSVQGAGIDFDGQWFVRGVTTTLKRGSLTQSFSLDRNAMRPYSDTVPVPSR
jgi:hypothetical protein